jgi:hypothetical protein
VRKTIKTSRHHNLLAISFLLSQWKPGSVYAPFGYSMKKLFEPGQMVATFGGLAGMVISKRLLAILRKRSREGRRPGHAFTPGECHDPDYIQEVPVAFEDGTFDVMRSTNVRRQADGQDEKRAEIQRQLDQMARPNGAE